MKAPTPVALASTGKTPAGPSGRSGRRPSSSSRRVTGPRRTADRSKCGATRRPREQGSASGAEAARSPGRSRARRAAGRPHVAGGTTGSARAAESLPSPARPTSGGADVAAWVAQHAIDAPRTPELAETILCEAGYGSAPAVTPRALNDLQASADRAAPGVANVPGVSSDKVNRQQRRAQRRSRKPAPVVAAMIARCRAEGADPHWKPEAFPALDWRASHLPSGDRHRGELSDTTASPRS